MATADPGREGWVDLKVAAESEWPSNRPWLKLVVATKHERIKRPLVADQDAPKHKCYNYH